MKVLKKARIFLLLICLTALISTAVPAADAASGTCGKNLTWEFENGVLTISGTGEMTSDIYSSYAPWYSLRESITSVVIEGGATNIVMLAFSECSNLTSISIPNSVTSIGSYAFYGCSSLKEISIPNSITEIGEQAFSGCTALQSIVLPDSVANIGKRAFMNCSSLTCVTLPKDLTCLEEAVFYGCSTLTNIEIPSGVTKISYSAFYGCSSLDGIEIPSGVSEIGIYAFAECKALTGIEIPNSVTEIGMYAFYNCSHLTGVSLSDSLSEIESYLFYGCSSLTEIEIPDSVISIGSYAFYGCGSLKDVTLPNGVTEIGSYAFYKCSALEEITLPSSITALGSYAFYGCSALTEITIPEGITAIENYAFYKCTALTDVTFPDYMTAIGNYAFCSCAALTRITIPEGVTSIGIDAFFGCSSLLSVVLPVSVSSIGNSAFRKCDDLINVYYGGSEEEWSVIEIESYNTCLTSATIHYNSSGASDVVSGTCGQNLTWTLEDRVLTISGTGAMSDVNMEKSPWYSYRTEITKVVVEAGVTGIGTYAFYDCSNLTAVTLPESVTNIGELAFFECASLTDIEIPSGVREIGFGVFENCESLRSIVIPQGAVSIGEVAFFNCVSLESIVIPDSVTTIGTGAFYNCPMLSEVTLSKNITYIDDSVFYGCSALTSITIPDGVTTLGDYAFAKCSLLSSITIPDSVVSIGAYAFYECPMLNEVYYSGYRDALLEIEIGSHNTDLTGAVFYDADDSICAVLPTVTLWKTENTAVGVVLEWDEISETDGYRIYRRTEYESYELIAAVDSETAGYTDTAVENGVTYYYYVQAYSGAAISFYTQKCITYQFSNVTQADELIPEATNNTGDQNYGVFGDVVNSYLTQTDEGLLLRVEYTGEQIVAEYYNSDYELIKKYYIPVELSIFGGFYAGEDAYYLVFGQPNHDEDDNVEVVRVVKYSKDWERLDKASLCGANTYTPFSSGSCRMAEYDGKLYIHTCHILYATTDGVHHQANMEITVTEDSMNITANYGVSNYYSYVSHSFNQFVIVDDDGHEVVLDQGDAYPRGVALNGTNVFPFEGIEGYNPTGASLGGLEYSDTSYLVAGNSVTQDSNWYNHTARNIFLIVKNRETSEISVNWMTDYDTDGEISASTPQLVKLGSNSFLLMWTTTEYLDSTLSFSRQTKLHYVYLDGEGNAVSEIHTVTGQLSDCKPIVYDGSVLWYVTGDADGDSSDSAPCFCMIDADGIYSTELEAPSFTAEFAEDGGFLVNWDAVEGADGYYIYLAQPLSASSYTTQREIVVGGTTTDATVIANYSGRNCFIWVTAWSDSGGRSLAENKAMYWYLAAPSVTLDYTEEGVVLNWNAVSGAASYEIYRKSENGEYSLLGTTEDVSWTDTDIIAGYAYTYQIFSCAGDYTSVGSAEESIVTYSSIVYSGDFALRYSIVAGEASIVGYSGDVTNVNLAIPDTIAGCPVTEIADKAFYRCKTLISVILPDSVTCIGSFAFSQCENLKEVTFGSGLTVIEESAFASCWELNNIVLPKGLVSIGKKAFWNCFMTNVAIPLSVTQIGEAAFQYCYELDDVYYGGSEAKWNVIEIGDENDYLTSATIHFNNPNITSVSVEKVDDAVIVTIDFETLAGGTLIAVGYGESGEMLDTKTVSGNTAELSADVQTVKVFLWDSLSSMLPLCEATVQEVN